jgi:hypothetical protein
MSNELESERFMVAVIGADGVLKLVSTQWVETNLKIYPVVSTVRPSPSGQVRQTCSEDHVSGRFPWASSASDSEARAGPGPGPCDRLGGLGVRLGPAGRVYAKYQSRSVRSDPMRMY